METLVGEPGATPRSSTAETAAEQAKHADDRIRLASIPIALGIIVGMGLGIEALTMVAAVAGILISVVSPPVGLMLIAFMGPLKPPDVIPAPGFSFALVGATLLGCVYRLPIDRPRIRLIAPIVLVLAFFLYIAVQQLPEMVTGYAGDEPHRIGYQFIQFAALVGTAIAAGYVLRQQRPYPYLAACLAAACIAAILAVATYDNPQGALPLAGLLAQTDDGTRAVGPFGNPNYFGHFLATAIAATLGWSFSVSRGSMRWALVGVAVLLGVALALSLSRGAIAALLAGLAVLVLLRSRPAGIAFVLAGLVAVIFVYPAFVEWRLGSATGAAYSVLNASDAGRLDAVLAGPQLFLSAPLFGIGFGHYSLASAAITHGHISIGSHNWYMSVIAEQGLVGAVLWSLLLVSVVLHLTSRPAAARWVGFGVLGVFAAGSFFSNQPASFQTSVLPLIVITAALVGDWTRPANDDRPPRRNMLTIRRTTQGA